MQYIEDLPANSDALKTMLGSLDGLNLDYYMYDRAQLDEAFMRDLDLVAYTV